MLWVPFFGSHFSMKWSCKNVLRELLTLKSGTKMFKWNKWTIWTDFLNNWSLKINFYAYNISDRCYTLIWESFHSVSPKRKFSKHLRRKIDSKSFFLEEIEWLENFNPNQSFRESLSQAKIPKWRSPPYVSSVRSKHKSPDFLDEASWFSENHSKSK